MNRNDVTEKIITVKVAKGLQWADVAKKVGCLLYTSPSPRDS